MARGVLYLDSCTHISKVCLEQLFVLWCVRLLKDNCQQASRAKTRRVPTSQHPHVPTSPSPHVPESPRPRVPMSPCPLSPRPRPSKSFRHSLILPRVSFVVTQMASELLLFFQLILFHAHFYTQSHVLCIEMSLATQTVFPWSNLTPLLFHTTTHKVSKQFTRNSRSLL